MSAVTRQTIRAFHLILIGALSFSCGSVGRRTDGFVTPFLVYPIEKLRSGETYERSVSATVRAAGNEREPVILGVVNDSPGEVRITGVTIQRDGPRSVEADLYRVIPYTVTTRTSLFPGKDVGKGDWSDALVPIEFADTMEPDSIESGSTRSPSTAPEFSAVFTPPIGISPSDTVSFLLELYLPADVPRISENLRVVLFTESGGTFTYTVRIDPYPFTLPSTSSLRTAFGFTWPAVAGAHERLSSEPFDAAELHYEYLRVLSEHRISVYNPQLEPVTVTRGEDGRLAVDWTAFDETTGRLLDGTLFPGVPPATSFRFPPAQEGAASEDLSEYYRLAAEHLADRGWLLIL